jgi:hypothetical protein
MSYAMDTHEEGTMKRNIAILGELAMAIWIGFPVWVGAACPGAQTYFFSGHGDLILPKAATSSCDADVVLNGDLTTSNGVSCLPGCPTTATATASITEVIKTGACGIPNSSQGGYDGISCDQIASVTIKADCQFESPLSPSKTPTRTLNNNTIKSSVPTPVLSDPFPGTPAAVCASFVGSTFDSVAYISADEEAYDAVATHGAGCSSATYPCPKGDRVEQFTPAIDIQGHSVLNSVAP